MRRWPGLIAVLLLVVSGACRGGGEEVQAATVVTDTGDRHPRIRAMLAHECVEAGGEQTLSVEVEGALSVTYLSTYADGQTGRAAPYGGDYGGEGDFSVGATESAAGQQTGTETWTVAEEAPPGLVVVYVTALLTGFRGVDPDDALTRPLVSFRLLEPGQECPGPPLDPPAVVTDTGDDHPEVRLMLERECVRAGRQQVLSAETERGGAVRWVSIYANGENGHQRPKGGGYGGVGVGLAQPGVPSEQGWTIEENAPAGIVTVHVATSISEQEPVHQRLTFRLVGPEEECP